MINFLYLKIYTKSINSDPELFEIKLEDQRNLQSLKVRKEKGLKSSDLGFPLYPTESPLFLF